MIIDWIYKKLIQMRDKKRHNCLCLKWQIAELQGKIDRAKQNG